MQCESLGLKFWESPPVYCADPNATLAAPETRANGAHAAAKLLLEMQAHGISRYHPDPRSAIEAAAERAALIEAKWLGLQKGQTKKAQAKSTTNFGGG